jgi:7,8-dihydroneopterin aldolase/epimerase/oxygenase
MFSIKVNNLKLFGYHGVHKEEAIVGGEFLINISVDFEENGLVEKLEQTLNYVRIVEVVQELFTTRCELLETLSQKIAQEIKTENNFIKKINISIEKLNAPISNFTGTVSVHYSKSY